MDGCPSTFHNSLNRITSNCPSTRIGTLYITMQLLDVKKLQFRDVNVHEDPLRDNAQHVPLYKFYDHDPEVSTRNVVLAMVVLKVTRKVDTSQIYSYPASQRSSSTKNNRPSRSQHHDRQLLLYCPFSPPSSGNTCFLLFNSSSNDVREKFGCPETRDVGFSPGSLIIIQKPCIITSWMGQGSDHEIPIVEISCRMLSCVTKYSFSRLPEINVDHNTNKLSAFCCKKAKLTVLDANLVLTCCAGLMCDAVDTANCVCCGCWTPAPNVCRMVVNLKLKLDMNEESHIVENFRSRLFTKELFARKALSRSVNVESWNLYRNIQYRFEDNVVKAFENGNRKGGFSVIGWYRRGMTKQNSVVSQEANVSSNDNHVIAAAASRGQLESSTLNLHLTSIKFNGNWADFSNCTETFDDLMSKAVESVKGKRNQDTTQEAVAKRARAEADEGTSQFALINDTASHSTDDTSARRTTEANDLEANT